VQEKVLQYLVQNGLPAKKINLGIPLYGQSYQLASSSSNGIGAKTVGRGRPGEFTRQAGMLSFYEICQAVTKNSWTKVPGTAERGPYAFRMHSI
jgi:chitinase